MTNKTGNVDTQRVDNNTNNAAVNSEIELLKQRIRKLEESINEKNVAYEKLQTEFNEFVNAAKQIAADFDNYRKRIASDREKEKALAIKSFIVKILPVIDNFSLCLENTSQKEEFIKGVSLVYSQIISLLEDIGLKAIPAINQKFDPILHEAILQIPSEREDKTILEEVQRGYMLEDTILRTSKVKIAKQTKSKEE